MNEEKFRLNTESVNEETMNAFKVSMTPSAIPNIDEMLTHIDKLIDFIETPKMKKLEFSNNKEFERQVYAKFNTILPMSIINLLVEGDRYEHLERLLEMCNTLKKVKNGELDIHEEHGKFSEKLNTEYLYPKFGGKENFEKEMKKQS